MGSVAVAAAGLCSGGWRFYLLFPTAAVAIYLAAVPDRSGQASLGVVPALVYVGILTARAWPTTLPAAMIVPDGSGSLPSRSAQADPDSRLLFLGRQLLVIVPLRLLRQGVCWLDERWFGPFAEAKRGQFPRTLLREVLPALVTVPLLLPYFMGVVYVHRFKMPNTTNPEQVLHRGYEDVAFTTADGLRIRGWFLPAAKPSERTLVICHGLGANRSNFLPYCEVGDALHANVLIFDFRGHGDSDGHTTSFGYYERFDVLAALKYLRDERPEQAREVYAISINVGSSALLRRQPSEPAVRWRRVVARFPVATGSRHILADFPAAARLMNTCGVPIAYHAVCWLPDVKPIDSRRIRRRSSSSTRRTTRSSRKYRAIAEWCPDRMRPSSQTKQAQQLAAGKEQCLGL